MMPPGLTASLNNDDFVHLVAYLSQLGKEGKYKFSHGGYIRQMDILYVDSKMFKEVYQTDSSFWSKLDQHAWQPIYAKMNGSYPLKNDYGIMKQPAVMKKDINVTKGGDMSLDISNTKIRVFLNGQLIRINNGNVKFQLKKGKNQLVFVVGSGAGLSKDLTIKIDQKISNAVFE